MLTKAAAFICLELNVLCFLFHGLDDDLNDGGDYL